MAANSTKINKRSSETIKISIDGRTLLVILKRSDHRRTIQISINQEREIILHTPRSVSKAQLEDILDKRLEWIRKNLKKIEDSAAKRFIPQWIEGEIHYYLGQGYPLKISCGDHPMFEFENGVFRVCVDQPDDIHKIQFLMRRWYQRQAKTLFRERLAYWLEQTRPILQLEQTEIPLRVKAMKTRWGSCSSLGRINLNLQLIQLSLDCLDYVIVHELCHFREMNHSKRFWSLVTQCMPDWKIRRALLKQQSMATWLK
ncbi:protein of unknown function DUF45 [[Leptolyngbya] sp. PCC 7376]|uniref:M48 family metallopeptidase n=1 Tax=[Leptolyngbya] sp. PCC 7376 TaxID=111781 RepID=UPI00029F1C40|nr:SprT family zinc-dependent metalloprotease [[Leptolyngbya] sp. PCC 7376]AFY38412.1 protein of unknown function DUF45 [[Leptolyngbya] sp. PCC 7376]